MSPPSKKKKDNKDSRAAKRSKMSPLRMKKKKSKEGKGLDASSEVSRISEEENLGKIEGVHDKKDTRAAKRSKISPVKMKKKKSKERKSLDTSSEVSRSSENEEKLGNIEEHKIIKRKTNKVALKEKGKRKKRHEGDISNEDPLSDKDEHIIDATNCNCLDPKDESSEKKKTKLVSKKKRRREKQSEIDSRNGEQLSHKDEHQVNVMHSVGSTPENEYATHSQTLIETSKLGEPKKAKNRTKIKTNKVKERAKDKKKDLHSAKEQKIEATVIEADTEKVYEISSVDEDCSRGMKKWLRTYTDSRPGLQILQQRIDDFITAHEEKQEQERKEREALMAEEGWTPVVPHKGRKKTTDAASGIAVGSVSQAAVLDKMSKKKTKEVPLDFYRFKRRENHRNELMMLQSKFEQDKKRIQQLRAARKFQPY